MLLRNMDKSGSQKQELSGKFTKYLAGDGGALNLTASPLTSVQSSSAWG